MNQGFLHDSNVRIDKLKYDRQKKRARDVILICIEIERMQCVFFREEIRELESKVQKERERYKLSTQTISGGFSAIPLMPINSAVFEKNKNLFLFFC